MEWFYKAANHSNGPKKQYMYKIDPNKRIVELNSYSRL